ncbi:MAG: PH domain-containing protein, partial [Rhodothermales bacterium]|nr:PH domain-containing protein [Rhodothermales bacterium]
TGTIPLRKVQAFIIRTNPLMRRFGWYRLEVQTMGFDVKERGHKVAVPFGRMEDVLRTANRIQTGLPHPDPLGVRQPDLQPVSKLTIRRAFIRYAVALGIVTAGLWYLWSPGVWLLTLLPLALVAAILRYRFMGWGEDERWLYLRRGVIRQHTWLLPVERAQVLYRSSSLFQRRLGLASVAMDSAGASVTRPAEAVDLPEDVARGLVDRTYARFKAIHEVA